MAYLALYRKYRPRTFDEVIGQDHIVKTLINQIKLDKISHAYLFCGSRGTGKTSTAKIFAKAINCENSKNGSPCLECETCKALDGTNIDVLDSLDLVVSEKLLPIIIPILQNASKKPDQTLVEAIEHIFGEENIALSLRTIRSSRLG